MDERSGRKDAPPNELHEQPIVKSGYLHKETQGAVKRFQKRFFALRGRFLTYDKEQRGTVSTWYDLTDASIRLGRAGDMRIIVISFADGLSLSLRADSAGGATSWYQFFCRAGTMRSQSRSMGSEGEHVSTHSFGPGKLGFSTVFLENGVVQVDNVAPGSQADTMGIKQGDAIISYGGTALQDIAKDAFLSLVETCSRPVDVEFSRAVDFSSAAIQ